MYEHTRTRTLTHKRETDTHTHTHTYTHILTHTHTFSLVRAHSRTLYPWPGFVQTGIGAPRTATVFYCRREHRKRYMPQQLYFLRLSASGVVGTLFET